MYTIRRREYYVCVHVCMHVCIMYVCMYSIRRAGGIDVSQVGYACIML